MTAIRHGWTEHHWVWQDTTHAEGVRVTSYLCECGKTKKVVTVLKKRVKKQTDAPTKPPRKPQNRLSRPRHSKPAKKGKTAPESKCVRKTRLKPVSSKRSAENRKYLTARLHFLRDHPICQVTGCQSFSNQIHHKMGREKSWLLNEAEWLACCGTCHDRIHNNPEWAKSEGLLKLRICSQNKSQLDSPSEGGL